MIRLGNPEPGSGRVTIVNAFCGPLDARSSRPPDAPDDETRIGGARCAIDPRRATLAAMPPHRANYRLKLTHVVVLADGTKLVTLRDAANVLLAVFGSVNARSGALDHTIQRLLAAATTGKHADIAAATDSIERALRARRLL
jgi:hypothetical protein